MSRSGTHDLAPPLAAAASERDVSRVRPDRLTLAIFGVLVAFYAILGLVLLAPEAVYSGDIGVKFVQARALASNGFGSLDIPYPGAFLDPAREFFPMRPPFVMEAAGTTQAIFPPISAVVQAWAAMAGGIRGLIFVSILAAAMALAATWAMVPRASAALAVAALGASSPLWFYAISGWEHAPAHAVSTAAFALAIVRPSNAGAIAAGALIGAGAAMRDEVLLLLPGLLLAVWVARREVRPVLLAIAGAIVPLACAAAIEVWWFQRPAAAHLRHAVHILQVALQLTSEPNPDVPMLRPFTLRDRYETVVNYWLFGSSHNAAIAAFAGGLLLAWVIRWRWRSSAGFVVWLAAAALVAAADLREVLTAPKWLAGLFRVAPCAALAFLPAPAGARREPLPALVGAAAAAYLILAFVGVDTSGGKSLGPRLLLPIIPLLVASAAVRIVQYWKAPRTGDRAVAALGALLVAAGVAFHAGGTIPAYHTRNAEDASAVVAAGTAPDRIVVADDPFTAQLLFPLYYRKTILLADSADLGSRLGAALSQQRVPGAILVSRNPSPAVSLAPMRLDRSEQQGRMTIQYWRR